MPPRPQPKVAKIDPTLAPVLSQVPHIVAALSAADPAERRRGLDLLRALLSAPPSHMLAGLQMGAPTRVIDAFCAVICDPDTATAVDAWNCLHLMFDLSQVQRAAQRTVELIIEPMTSSYDLVFAASPATAAAAVRALASSEWADMTPPALTAAVTAAAANITASTDTAAAGAVAAAARALVTLGAAPLSCLSNAAALGAQQPEAAAEAAAALVDADMLDQGAELLATLMSAAVPALPAAAAARTLLTCCEGILSLIDREEPFVSDAIAPFLDAPQLISSVVVPAALAADDPAHAPARAALRALVTGAEPLVRLIVIMMDYSTPEQLEFVPALVSALSAFSGLDEPTLAKTYDDVLFTLVECASQALETMGVPPTSSSLPNVGALAARFTAAAAAAAAAEAAEVAGALFDSQMWSPGAQWLLAAAAVGGPVAGEAWTQALSLAAGAGLVKISAIVGELALAGGADAETIGRIVSLLAPRPAYSELVEKLQKLC